MRTRLRKADPETDWDRVDIDLLRTHLVDMNELTLNAVVETQELQMIQAIGFLGVMATGAHHQEHHLAMASGEMEH